MQTRYAACVNLQNYFIKDLATETPSAGADAVDANSLQPALYHRYNVVEEGDDDDDDNDSDDDDAGGSGVFTGSAAESAYGAQMMAEALSAMHISDGDGEGLGAQLPHHMELDSSTGKQGKHQSIALKACMVSGYVICMQSCRHMYFLGCLRSLQFCQVVVRVPQW